MAWTYNPDALETSEKDRVRLEIQDTDPNKKLLQDEEITHVLTLEHDFWSAAARCCEIIHRHFALKADVRMGRALFVLYSKMSEQYGQMAKDLRKQAISGGAPFAGGIYVADKLAYEQDATLVQPAFTRKMQENPRVGGYTSDTVAPDGGDPEVP